MCCEQNKNETKEKNTSIHKCCEGRMETKTSPLLSTWKTQYDHLNAT